jgi:hypothetical protein
MLEELLYYFEGLDDSIIKLNDYIFDSGFEFVRYTLEEFEKKYRRKFREVIPHNYLYNCLLGLNRLGCINGREIFENKYVIFLDDKHKNYIEEEEEKEVNYRVNKLIENLKLFKSGHIKLISAFEFPLESEFEFIGPIIYSPPLKYYTYLKYSLSDTDPLELKVFKEQLTIPPYLQLAFNSFIEYYNIEDVKLKFIMLMIAL